MTDASEDISDPAPDSRRWYEGITRYQWIVLLIASAGWVFDVYEGQIFNITRAEMLADLIDPDLSADDRAALVAWYGDAFLGVFLVGGTIGGLLFGSLADRYGRRPIMIATILMYSVFSGLTYFATELWQVAALRLLVAVGVGGEWAVAASLVAEAFPTRARAQAAAIFHASSIIGTWIAGLAGYLVGSDWRYAYLVGILPAVLIVWVRSRVREPENWRSATTDPGRRRGSFVELLTGAYARSAWLGLLLAAVGLATFWSVTVAGQTLAAERLVADGYAADAAQQTSKLAYGLVQATGGGLGLLAFGPLCARIGRRPTFILFQVGALLITPIVCFLPQSYGQLLALLPLYGFLTMGIHSGFAIYFPELFPTHLRATGASFCFNGGRLLAAPLLIWSGELKARLPDLQTAVWALSLLFVVGIAVTLLLPETRGRELPE